VASAEEDRRRFLALKGADVNSPGRRLPQPWVVECRYQRRPRNAPERVASSLPFPFGHISGQGGERIGDFESRELAEEVYARITGEAYDE
jgi:hypothetical protein